jgi:hypothetical protein
MALPILDGNQSATTLSSILTSGEHIPAHTVVSLGTQAITDISGAVSGSVVSISNFPATQTIAGTVTAFGEDTVSGGFLPIPLNDGGEAVLVDIKGAFGSGVNVPISGTVTANLDANSPIIASQVETGIASYAEDLANAPFPISGTVTVGNSVTIASFATSVTARLINPAGTAVTYAEVGTAGSPSIDVLSVQGVTSGTAIPISISSVTIGALPAISGTVTANTFALQGTAVTTSDFTSTTDSTVLANYNASREVLTIFNEGAGNLHICAGATCTTIAYQVRLSAGDYYEVPNHQTTITHSAVFATAGTARVTEVS